MKQILTCLALASGLCLPLAATQPALQTASGAPAVVRPKIMAIFISVAMPDGSVRNFSFDPVKTEALFFTDRAVTDMLGRFYDFIGTKSLPAEALIQRFGVIKGQSLMAGGGTYPISSASLTTLWSTPNQEGIYPALILKTPECEPTQWP